MLRDLQISGSLVIPARFLSVRFARAGGPGGQHVNKVESKVDLRLDLEAAAECLGEERVSRIRSGLQGRLDGEGRLCLVTSEHRSQAQNMELALERMEVLIRTALTPRPKRRPTRPTRASRERRLTQKRQRSRIKKQRGDKGGDKGGD